MNLRTNLFFMHREDGPGDLSFLKLFKAIKARRFAMIGSGEVRYQVIYISDLIDGVILCARTERAIGNVYILTGNGPATLNQLVRTIAQVLGVCPTGFVSLSLRFTSPVSFVK